MKVYSLPPCAHFQLYSTYKLLVPHRNKFLS